MTCTVYDDGISYERRSGDRPVFLPKTLQSLMKQQHSAERCTSDTGWEAERATAVLYTVRKINIIIISYFPRRRSPDTLPEGRRAGGKCLLWTSFETLSVNVRALTFDVRFSRPLNHPTLFYEPSTILRPFLTVGWCFGGVFSRFEIFETVFGLQSRNIAHHTC